MGCDAIIVLHFGLRWGQTRRGTEEGIWTEQRTDRMDVDWGGARRRAKAGNWLV